MDSVAVEQLGSGRETPKKTALNFWVDLITTILFATLLGSGALMKWILPPGTCDEATLKLWLGHARHWWGDIHFWIAMSMLVLLLLHIYLHWGWVVKLWARLLGKVQSPQSVLVTVMIFGLMAIPFIIPAQVIEVPAVAGQEASGVENSAEVAPCGIEGLSCETCPASDDRLFGSKDKDEAEASACSEVVEDSNATDCTDEPSDCSTCPSAAECPSASDAGGDSSS